MPRDSSRRPSRPVRLRIRSVGTAASAGVRPSRRPLKGPVSALPRLRDRVAPGIRVLFVGINPGIRSALTGHHFAGNSNRFWRLLRDSGLVPEPIGYEQDVRLPEWGFGITNLVARPSRGIDDLAADEYSAGRRALFAKVARLRPAVVALVGVTLYRALFPGVTRVSNPSVLGLRPQTIRGAAVFVLPNPSGRNANFSYAQMLEAFKALRSFLRKTQGSGLTAHGAQGSGAQENIP